MSKRREIPPEKKLTPSGNKPREKPPPGMFIRTRGGMPGELRRTKHTTTDGRWLFRVWFGDVTGSTLWTVESLENEGVTFLKRHPRDLRSREEAREEKHKDIVDEELPQDQA